MQQPLKPWTLAAYSGISLPMAAMGMPIAVYLPRFYSEGLGLSLITVGLIFTVARVWDVVTDPAMGYISTGLKPAGAVVSIGSQFLFLF